jgi:hypothetical protein
VQCISHITASEDVVLKKDKPLAGAFFLLSGLHQGFMLLFGVSYFVVFPS